VKRIDRHPRVNDHDPRFVGFLNVYLARMVAAARDHGGGHVATATFPGMIVVPAYLHAPRLSRRYLQMRDFWKLVFAYFDDQLPAVMPAVVYLELADHILWSDICVNPGAPGRAKSAASVALRDATAVVGAAPLETWLAPGLG
jgi:hypothetical protein